MSESVPDLKERLRTVGSVREPTTRDLPPESTVRLGLTTPTPALTDESEELYQDHADWVRDPHGTEPIELKYLRARLAAIEAKAEERAVARHVRETGCEEHERTLASARFVATYWRDAWLEQFALGERHAPLVTHPLAMVLGALDGETDPVDLGISPDRHADYRAALAAREEVMSR